MHGGNASLDAEVLMDTREEGSARDRDRDRDRDRERDRDRTDEPLTASMHFYRHEERRESSDELVTDPTATHLADFWKMRLVRYVVSYLLPLCVTDKYFHRQQAVS